MDYNIQMQHEKKKYHAIERLKLLFDRDTFFEIGGNRKDEKGRYEYDGVITGRGLVNGKCVFSFSQDFTIHGGSIGLCHGEKIAHIINMAIENKCPVVGIYDSGGARINEGIKSLAGCGEMMYANTRASGYIPQLSMVLGPCAGAASYSPAISDFIFCVNSISNMYITGPKVIEKITGEICMAEELGGANVHSRVSGVAHVVCSSEKMCFQKVRSLIDMLPSWYGGSVKKADISLLGQPVDWKPVLPKEPQIPYDIKKLLLQCVDSSSFFEIHTDYAGSLVVGFAQICGETVGIIANQPMNNGGALDCDSSDKGARFIRFCDSFNIPVITFVDTPGYLPGLEQEHNGIIRHGAKLLFAYAEATSIKITIVVRKAYGGAYIAMGSKHLGADYVYALPGAEIAVMGAEGATEILYAKELKECKDDGEKYQYIFQNKMEEYKLKYMNATQGLNCGYVDDVIRPEEIRHRISYDLCSLQREKETNRILKKHSNIPL
ncbi:propionyl-CoA carboxylase beta chain [Kineothrix alysoides]|uniref:Propionyl-CoA carboxylase beta chain n=1 Tax=Kineothrix alysoides TaxID=1469948 RepID=A0A4R1QX12_9FIRM|nr:acyl-CoA carboxylase subunit beta [Kineothrix alysoides]TCL57585.1 propionyl-CoA carboxylase beta chain [Kineothrix alysoides]